jgi:hypothetical protein
MAKRATRPRRAPEPGPSPRLESATLTDAAVATLVTGAAFAGEWLAVTSASTGAMAKTLANVLRGDDTLEGGVRSALDAYGQGLRDLALLPRTYGVRFFQELEQSRAGHIATPPAEPARTRRAPRRNRRRKR